MFVKSITAIDDMITPEYIVTVFTMCPTLVSGFNSPNPTVEIVMNVNHTEFSNEIRILLLLYSAILMAKAQTKNHNMKDVITATIEFSLNQHLKA